MSRAAAGCAEADAWLQPMSQLAAASAQLVDLRASWVPPEPARALDLARCLEPQPVAPRRPVALSAYFSTPRLLHFSASQMEMMEQRSNHAIVTSFTRRVRDRWQASGHLFRCRRYNAFNHGDVGIVRHDKRQLRAP